MHESRPSPTRWWPWLLVVLTPGLFFLPFREAEAGARDTAEPPQLELTDWPSNTIERQGRKVYELYCIGCHGEEGRGDGEAAAFLDPKPRDFQHGDFKFRSTPSGKLPKVEDLMHTITCGLPGSAMPSFPLVSETERRAVSRYVQNLALFGKAKIELKKWIARRKPVEEFMNSLPDIKAKIRKKRLDDVSPISVTSPPKVTPELIAKGKDLFMQLCYKCHGETGRGDGPSSHTQRDWKDAEVKVRDFTQGVFRAGGRPRDLFLRIRTGLDGTSMGATTYGTDEEIWGVVQYVLSLRDPNAKPARQPAGCSTSEEGR